MERVHYVDAEQLEFTGGFADVTEARKSPPGPGRYHLISIVEADIEVEPPPPATGLVVKRGKVMVTRKHANAEADSE